MKEKLNCIILIDDNATTNFMHKIVVEKANCTKKCIAFQCAIKALDYLKKPENRDFEKPDLIMLDINMPIMDGWGFLEAYENLKDEQKAQVVVVMLTTSINPEDREKAESFGIVKDFLNKPLTKDMIFEQIKIHFPEKI